MHHTVSHNTAPPGDARLTAARQALAELPPACGNDDPYFWTGRLQAALTDLVAMCLPGRLDAGQRQVVASALADAITYRTPEGHCADCEAEEGGLCYDHAADLDRCDDYLQLARELAIEVER